MSTKLLVLLLPLVSAQQGHHNSLLSALFPPHLSHVSDLCSHHPPSLFSFLLIICSLCLLLSLLPSASCSLYCYLSDILSLIDGLRWVCYLQTLEIGTLETLFIIHRAKLLLPISLHPMHQQGSPCCGSLK